VIYQLDGVLENAVVGVPHEKWGEVGRAFVVLKSGANLDEAAVIEHCAGQLRALQGCRKEVPFHRRPTAQCDRQGVEAPAART